MNTNVSVERYLAVVEKDLKCLPRSERTDALAQIESKIEEVLFFSNSPIEETLINLGDPHDVALSYLESFVASAPSSARTPLMRASLAYQEQVKHTPLSQALAPTLTSLVALFLVFVGVALPITGFVNTSNALIAPGITAGVASLQISGLSLHPALLFPLSLGAGALLIACGIALWRSAKKHLKETGLQSSVQTVP